MTAMEEFGAGMAVAEAPEEELEAEQAAAPAPVEEAPEAEAPAATETSAAEAPVAAAAEQPAKAKAKAEDAFNIDVEIDNGIEWEVETEPAPDPQPAYSQPRSETYYDEQPIPVARSINKHLFTWVFAFYLGIFGADRFVRGQTALGVLKMLTFGGFGFWYLADMIIALAKSYLGGYSDMQDLLFDNMGRYIY